MPAVRAAFARALGRALALSVRWSVVERERERRAREAAKREEGSDDDDAGGGGREKRKSGKGSKADGKGTPTGGDGGKSTPTGGDGGKGKGGKGKKASRWKKKKKKGKEEEPAFAMHDAVQHLEALFARAQGRANRVAVAQAYVALLRAARRDFCGTLFFFSDRARCAVAQLLRPGSSFLRSAPRRFP